MTDSFRKRPRSGAVKHRTPPTGAPSDEESPSRGERLQKVLAAAGVASRRDCEELILAGRVEVDRRVVSTLGTRVDPLGQEIRVDGVSLPQPKRAYFLLNKPAGVVCTNDDPSGRARVVDLVRSDLRLFPVGRLDRTTEGLIIVTNDGALSNRLTHPRYGIEKTYLARCAGHLDQRDFDRLRRGVRLADGMARVESIKLKKRHPQSSELIIVLKEGRNREIRRVLASVGHKVLQLRRIAIGPIRIEDMPIGAYRKLLPEEVQLLEHAARDAKRSSRRRPEGHVGVRGKGPVVGEAVDAESPNGPSTEPPSRRPRSETRSTAARPVRRKGSEARPRRPGSGGHRPRVSADGRQPPHARRPSARPKSRSQQGPQKGPQQGPQKGPQKGPQRGPQRGPQQGPPRGPQKQRQARRPHSSEFHDELPE